MSNRIRIGKVDPAAYKVMGALEEYLKGTELTQIQHELIRIRASQINGCAYCVDKHSQDARTHGETERRIYALTVWRETPFFNQEERSILAITEAVTLISEAGIPEDVYQEAITVLGEVKTAQTIMAANIINAWNRIGIGTEMQPA